MSSFLKKSGRLGGAKSKVSSPDADLPADWMAQTPSSSSSSPQPTQDAAAARKRREEAEADAEAERRRLLNVNRYAAGGGGGGAAFTKMRKQEQSRLEKMQNQTFTRWVNLQLHAGGGGGGTAPMADLVQGLASGENLLRLLSVLSRKNASSSSSSLPGGEVRKGTPSLGGVGSRFQSLGNVEQAFKFMKEEGIPLIGIGPQDVSQGNLKLILGMMWSIIQHYRLVNLFDEPPAQQPNTSAPSTSSGAVAAKQGETREEQQRTSAKSDDGAQKSDKAAGVKDGSPQAAGEAVSPSAADERAVENKGDKKADVKAAKKDDKKKDKDSKKEKKLQAKEEKATAKKDVKKAKAEPAAAAAAKQTETARPSSAVGAEKARETTGAGGQPAIKAVTAARQPQQSVESSLLEWVRDKLADAPEGEKLQVNNVKELFADGRALPVLVNTIQPGSVDVKALDVKKPIENNKLALRAATEKLAVPALIEGDDLANGADVDGLSLILYLSYLKQADAHKVQAKEEANHAKQEATAAVETKAIEPASVHISDGEEKSKAGGNVIEKERNETKRDEATTAKTESEAETKTKTMEQANVIKNEEGKSKAEAEALTADAAAVVAVAKENVPETAGEALAPSSDGGDSKHAANKRPSSSQDFDAAPAAPTSDEREVKTNERVETIASKPSHEESEQQREAATNAHDEKSKKEEKKKKDKKKKKTKKSKKGKDAGGEDNNKKKKKTKASSKAVSAPVPAVKEVEPTTASTPDSAPSGKEAPAPAAKKALAPLPHSRLPTRGEDLSYLVGPSAGAPVKKPHSIQLAAIPERKKPVTTTVTAGVDPVSAFWYE